MIGAAGDNIFSGSWKEAVREEAREIALEMEGTWTGLDRWKHQKYNISPISRKKK
jgi:hypothetical protein